MKDKRRRCKAINKWSNGRCQFKEAIDGLCLKHYWAKIKEDQKEV